MQEPCSAKLRFFFFPDTRSNEYSPLKSPTKERSVEVESTWA